MKFLNLLLVLSLKLLSPVISLPYYAFCTGPESLNALNTSLSLLPTNFSQLPNLHTFISSSLFNILAILALHPSLLLLGHRHHPLLKLLIATFVMLHHVSGINSLTSSSISDSPILSPITSASSDSPLCLSITLSFSPCLKPTSFTSPIPVVSLLPPGLPSRTSARTTSSKLLGFVIIFSLFFRHIVSF